MQMPNTPDAHRYGCFPMIIGAELQYRLPKNFTTESGRVMSAGQQVYLSVQDLTRHPHLESRWLCQHVSCQGKSWGTKSELVASHVSEKELGKNQEAHCYYAFSHVPFQPAKAEQKDKHGEVIAEATQPVAARIFILSDEDKPT